MFDFENANDAQREAIKTVDGPLLITAGPGTGKTFTLVKRALYLIQEKGVLPEQILMATFTEKAAKELVTRISNELSKQGINVNINDMYIGTFHSICLRILKDHLEHTRIKKNYRLLDDFDQPFIIYRNFNELKKLEGFDLLDNGTGGIWWRARSLAGKIDKLKEELVDFGALLSDRYAQVQALGRVGQRYEQMLDEENLLDFSSIQTECYRLLKGHADILAGVQSQIRYLMIDEYQDTNYIQEQLVFLLAGNAKNICVVGDDDQGLYRFRGATIRNILEFPGKFPKGVCRRVTLAKNYRSQKDIVDFYNRWMETTEGDGFRFSWGRCRYPKKIVPDRSKALPSATALCLTASDYDDYNKRILAFIRRLKDGGCISDYNQLAFLFYSVKDPRVQRLATYLEENGVNVYSPRANSFMQRDEIKLLLGCLLLTFRSYFERLRKRVYEFVPENLLEYYFSCVRCFNRFIKDDPDGHDDVKYWILSHRQQLSNLEEATNYSFSNMVYELCAFEPFYSILSTKLDTGETDLRPSRNLAHFTQLVGKFEYLYNINVFTPERIQKNVETFFNTYMRFLFDSGVNEHEDEKEYAPSGCVSFLTIHQSKGMEFPVVIVGSMWKYPRADKDDLMDYIAANYYRREAYEPKGDIKYFDFWRLFYTAFSRAQDFLVLASVWNWKETSRFFRGSMEMLPEVGSDVFHPEAVDIRKVKASNLKDSFSFTSQIAVYNACARQYKFYKELQFTPVRESAMIFGTLVHETIEDVHRAAIRHEVDTITDENLRRWFDVNYSSLVKRENAHLGKLQIEAAYRHVERYVKRHHGDWSHIQDAEVEVSLVKPEYIIDGKIDLVKGAGDTVELVDFKSEKKPRQMDERMEHYRQQLQLYAYLVEQKTGKKVSGMKLYYTSEEHGNPIVEFPYSRDAVNETVDAFDDTVQHILAKDFEHDAPSHKTCLNCDFRFYCAKEKC